MSDGIKIISDNRKAKFNYSLEDRFEAGIVLKGTEVKSLRDGKANIQDAYAIFKGNELFLLNAHIPHYKLGNINNHEPLRTRKLLLHRSELQKLLQKVETKHFSLVPTKLYFKEGKAKIEIALGKGKKTYDKRAAIKDQENRRQLDRLKRTAR